MCFGNGVTGRARQVRAVALAGALVAWSLTAGMEIPGRRHPVVQAALGTALTALTRAPLGLCPPALSSGVRSGLVAASAISAGVAASTGLPAVRAAMRARSLPQPVWKWLGVDIPLGTVWSEEAAFRAALGHVAADGFGASGGRLLQAAAFGLSHIADARATGEPVAATVMVTGVAGWVFGWLAEHTGSLAAPLLTHLAVNEAGALAALRVQRRSVSGRWSARRGCRGSAGGVRCRCRRCRS
jgi:membrane protease YdiL (CAAX protease family)